MPKKPKIEVEISYVSIPDNEFNKTLNKLKDWHVDEFIKWFNKYLKEKENLQIESC